MSEGRNRGESLILFPKETLVPGEYMPFKTLKPELIKSLNELNITKPTKIQELTLPLIREGKDVIGISKTGSGKTAAFGIPILEHLEGGKGPQYLIMGPTRELVVQIGQDLAKLAKYTPCKIVTIFGGVAIEPQIQKLTTADIVVGTPGRLLDHIGRETIDLSRISCVVLDEADKMVEMGFIEDITQILDHTPENRQLLLFGATISQEIEMLKQRYMHDPETVKTSMYVQEEYLKQYFYCVQPHEKFSILVHLLKTEKPNRVIIFCSARTTVDIVGRNLRRYGFSAEMIHGKLSQTRRLKVIEDFHHNKIAILVASAVAARGLHIEDVSHIINYDLSKDPQEYIHRVGRTARAGQSGKAITLLSERDHEAFRDILSKYDVTVKELPKPSFPRLSFHTGGDSRERRPIRGERRESFRGGYEHRGHRERRSTTESSEGHASKWGGSPYRV